MGRGGVVGGLPSSKQKAVSPSLAAQGGPHMHMGRERKDTGTDVKYRGDKTRGSEAERERDGAMRPSVKGKASEAGRQKIK